MFIDLQEHANRANESFVLVRGLRTCGRREWVDGIPLLDRTSMSVFTYIVQSVLDLRPTFHTYDEKCRPEMMTICKQVRLG